MQRADRISDRLAHQAHLALASLVEHQLDARGAETTDLRRGGDTVLELYSLREPAQRRARGLALDLGDVHLLDAVPRMREPMCQRSVVREEERTRGLRVEPSDRHDSKRVPDETDHGRPSLRVASRRHDPGRLVQENVGEPLRSDVRAVDLDHVGLADERVEPPRLAVDADSSCLDQLVRASPGGNPRAREVGVEPH